MKGQTIIEVAVALGVGVVILTAMTVLILTSLKNSEQGSSVTNASQYAQEGAEIMRRMRDSDFTTFASLTGTYCMAASCSALTTQAGTCGPKITSCGRNVNNRYVREVTVSQNDVLCKPPTPVSGISYTKVVSTVSWSDSTCASDATYCHNTKLESCLSNLDARSAP